jgi:hypothetical protein
MKAEAKITHVVPVYQPITLTVVVESAAEYDALYRLFGSTTTVPRALRYEGCVSSNEQLNLIEEGMRFIFNALCAAK